MLLEDVFSDLPLDKEDPALCKEVDPEMFFSDDRGVKAKAKEVCHRCESEAKCAEWALNVEGLEGVWGGMTKSLRAQIRKQRRSISRATGTIEECERAS